MKFTTHLNLVPRLRMSGAIPLLVLYTFMAWTGTTLPLLLYLFISSSDFMYACYQYYLLTDTIYC